MRHPLPGADDGPGFPEITCDGQRVPVPVGKTSELVVRLAREAGGFVRADRLVEDLWSSDGLATPRNTLHSKIAILRRALGDPDAITSHGGGYALGVDAANVDGLAVLRATATAARRLGDGNNRGTVEPPR